MSGTPAKSGCAPGFPPPISPLQYATLSVVYVPFIPLASLLVVNLLEPLLQPTVP